MSSDNKSGATGDGCQLTRLGVPRAALRRREKPKEVPYTPPELKGIEYRLVQAREAAGLDVSKVGTSRMERGYRLRNLQAVTVIRLAQKLGCNAGWLLNGDGPAPSRRRTQDPAPIRAEEIDE